MTTPPLRVVLADDEPLVRRGLARHLAPLPDVQLLAECADGDEAVRVVRATRPDLLLLDVQMPGLDGFGVLERLGEARPPAVIFVTAHDAFAVRAFEVHAVDYLLKPFDRERFLTALSRARARLARPPDDTYERLLAEVRPPERLVVRDGASTHLVPVGEVDWVEAADNYVALHTADGRELLLRETLKALELRLEPHGFTRVHRSALVNLARVRGLRALPTGDCTLELEGGRTLTLSRTFREGVEGRLGRR
jgi:two-component system, LytTR family, response regulator